MHHKNDVNRMSLRMGPMYRDLFQSICYGMCSIATMAEYNEQKQWLDETAKLFLDISQCVIWWDTRKYHMFPAFRPFSYSNIILAKSGNAVLECHTQLWLLEAAQDDTSTMLTQINEFHSFIVQASTSSGRGPCSLAHDRADRNTQICAVKNLHCGI